MTVWQGPFVLIVILVVIFSGPEGSRFSDFGRHLVTFALQDSDQVFDDFFLFLHDIDDFMIGFG